MDNSALVERCHKSLAEGPDDGPQLLIHLVVVQLPAEQRRQATQSHALEHDALANCMKGAGQLLVRR